MKTAASIFSWIGGTLTMVYGWWLFSPYLGMFGLFLIPLLNNLIIFIVLIWREYSVANGKKVACGVCTLIFCALVGGILTLCIPQNQLR